MSTANNPKRPSDVNELAASVVRNATAEPPPTRDEVLAAIASTRARAGRDPDALCDVETIKAWVDMLINESKPVEEAPST